MENITDFNELVDTVAANTDLTPAESAAAMGGLTGFLAGMATMIAVVCFVIWVLTVIARWRLFTKAGEKGWKSLIPLYSSYVYFKIIGLSFWKWFGILFLVGLVSSIGTSANIAALSTIGSILELCALLALDIFTAKNTAKAFGKGTGFMVGLFFIPTLFQLILGLGASEYEGVPEE